MYKDRSWIEIDLKALENNYQQIKKLLNDGVDIIAVVKSNAYGHGANIVVPYLAGLGIKTFAVATIDEAIAIREMGVSKDILILGYTKENRFYDLIKYDLIQTVFSYEYAIKMLVNTRVHLKIDTGMHRLGIDYDDLTTLDKLVGLSNIKIEGVFSHLASSELVDGFYREFNLLQLERFKQVAAYLTKYIGNVKYHILASYGLLNYPQYQFNCVRVGMLFYGFLSSEDESLANRLNQQNVLSLKSLIAQIKEIDKNEYIGYDNTYKTNRKTRVAVVPIGYYDGLPRNLSNTNLQVMVNGVCCGVVGNICMDQLMIDVTDVKVHINDEVVFVGKGMKAEKMAKHASCLTNELLSRLSNRNVRLIK